MIERSHTARPSVAAALGVYVGYLAIFFAVWIINDVDYMTIGATVESTKLHYAMPTLLGSAFIAVVLTVTGWWRVALFDDERSGPRWAWVGPIAMFVLAALGLATLRVENLTGWMVVWATLGGIGVGFGEEMITRGVLLTSLRARFTEPQAWLYSTLAFSALHIPNAFFGVPIVAVPFQVVMTFLLGSLLWATRRLSGTLLVPIFLHGFWDSSVFVPRSTGSAGNLWAVLIYPMAIVCAIGVLRHQRSAR